MRSGCGRSSCSVPGTVEGRGAGRHSALPPRNAHRAPGVTDEVPRPAGPTRPPPPGRALSPAGCRRSVRHAPGRVHPFTRSGVACRTAETTRVAAANVPLWPAVGLPELEGDRAGGRPGWRATGLERATVAVPAIGEPARGHSARSGRVVASRAISSAGERFVHTEEVAGSIPASPTRSEAIFHRWSSLKSSPGVANGVTTAPVQRSHP
jgi:hypothetical protein